MSKQISKQSDNDVEKRIESTVSEMNKIQKQISKQSDNDVEKRIESTVSEMNEIQKQINDNNHILENQKNLKLRHDALERELNQIKHTAST